MEKTPPRVTQRNNRNGQSSSAQAQGGAQLYSDIDGEDSSSPAPLQPNTPSPGNTSSSTDQLLQRILERLENIEKEVKDNKREVMDMKRDTALATAIDQIHQHRVARHPLSTVEHLLKTMTTISTGIRILQGPTSQSRGCSLHRMRVSALIRSVFTRITLCCRPLGSQVASLHYSLNSHFSSFNRHSRQDLSFRHTHRIRKTFARKHQDRTTLHLTKKAGRMGLLL